MEEKLKNCVPLSYVTRLDPGVKINPSCAEDFLKIFYEFKQNSPTEFIVSKMQYDKLLHGLLTRNYISPEIKDHYSKIMVTALTLKDRKKIVEENRDFDGAVELAKIYNEDNNQFLYSDSELSALYWLIMASQYKGFEELQKAIDLKEFFKSFKHLTLAAFLFNDERVFPFLPLLKDNLVELSFGTSFIPKSVNAVLANFIANNTTLKKLDLGTTWSWRERLEPAQMRFIAEGLKTNTSLEILNLVLQPIGDMGLIILLNALASNPNTHIRELHLCATRITTRGQQALEKFLETNTTLEHVYIDTDEGLTSEKIDALTARNKAAHQDERLNSSMRSLRMG